MRRLLTYLCTMRWLFIVFLVLTNVCLQAQTYDALNITLLDRWYQDSIITNSSQVRYSDCFGWTWKGREYAVIGSTEGSHIFELSEQNTFIPKGFIKGRYVNTSVSHRDYFTFKNYLYAVCDEGVSSLQIIDLQYLPDSVVLAKEDSLQFGRVHNIFIDTVQEKLYSLTHRSVTNTQSIEAPMKIFSLQNPLVPQLLWSGPDDVLEVHDAYVRNGVAFLNCGYEGLRIYDFTSTTSPLYFYSLSFYQEQGYNHQGWLTPDGKTYLFADETQGKRVKSYAFDGENLSFNAHFGTAFNEGSVPHNIMADNRFAYVAYYNEGFRIFDLAYPAPKEVAHFDTYPKANDPYPMNGNWGIYSLLPSKRLLLADRQNGLFMVYFNEAAVPPVGLETFTIAPNPSSENSPARLFLPDKVTDVQLTLFDTRGTLVAQQSIFQTTMVELPTTLAQGSYTVRIDYNRNNVAQQMTLRWEKL